MDIKPPSLSLSSVMHPFIKKKEEFDVILSPTSSPHSSPLSSSSSSSSSPIPSPSSLSLSPKLNSDREKLAKQRLEQYQIMNKQPTTSSSPSSIANIHVRQISPSTTTTTPSPPPPTSTDIYNNCLSKTPPPLLNSIQPSTTSISISTKTKSMKTTKTTKQTIIKTTKTTKTTKTPTSKTTKKKKKSTTKKKIKKTPIYINLELCKYDSVANCAKSLGWIPCEDDDAIDWNVFWTDTSVSNQRVMGLSKHQKINHFPGMRSITHKVPLAKNMMTMVRSFPNEFKHVPKSWALPSEKKLFRNKFGKNNKSKLNKTYILKPDHSCQGKGIVLCRTWDQVVAAMIGIEGGVVAQEYITDPLLIDGHKFDLRVYAVVVSVDPLRIHLYDDGLVRICAVKYKKPSAKAIANGFDRTAHLTNYAVNKTHEAFEFNDNVSNIGSGNKRTIEWFRNWIDKSQDIPISGSEMWTSVADVVNRTLIAVQPQLGHAYRTCIPDPEDDGFSCFEILGFDIMFKSNYDPILVEVNHSPSLTCGTPLDKNIKYGMLTETMRLIKVSGTDRRKEAQRTAAGAQSRLYSGFKGSEEKLKDAEKEIMLREKGWHSRMSKRKNHELKISKHFHLIHPTEESVTRCTRHEMQYIDDHKAYVLQQQTQNKQPKLTNRNSNGNSNGDVKEDEGEDEEEEEDSALDEMKEPIQPCLDARRLQSLGRPYSIFRQEASRSFAESTLGLSPTNRKNHVERQLLSSKIPRPLDYSASTNQTHPNHSNHSNHRDYIMPSVNGRRMSNEEEIQYLKEYRGEREYGQSQSDITTALQRLRGSREGNLSGSPSNHLPQTLGSHINKYTGSVNNIRNSHSNNNSNSNSKNRPQHLHKNSVLHSTGQRSIQHNGATQRVDFTAYMSKINNARDVEAEYRQMINKQLTRMDLRREVIEGMPNNNVNSNSARSIRNGRSTTPPTNRLQRGLPSMDRAHMKQRPSSMGTSVSSVHAMNHPGSVTGSYHHDPRNRNQNNNNNNGKSNGKSGKSNQHTIIVPTKYKKISRKAHSSLRMVGQKKQTRPLTPNVLQAPKGGDVITHRRSSMGPKFSAPVVQNGLTNSVSLKKDKRKVKKKKKKGTHSNGSKIKKVKKVTKKKKLTVESLFQRVH